MSKEKAPWVFWFRISIRKQWFSYLWKTRGNNFLELQIWIFCINIGMPWKHIVNDIKETNTGNLRYPYSFLIK